MTGKMANGQVLDTVFKKKKQNQVFGQLGMEGWCSQQVILPQRNELDTIHL